MFILLHIVLCLYIPPGFELSAVKQMEGTYLLRDETLLSLKLETERWLSKLVDASSGKQRTM